MLMAGSTYDICYVNINLYPLRVVLGRLFDCNFFPLCLAGGGLLVQHYRIYTFMNVS